MLLLPERHNFISNNFISKKLNKSCQNKRSCMTLSKLHFDFKVLYIRGPQTDTILD